MKDLFEEGWEVFKKDQKQIKSSRVFESVTVFHPTSRHPDFTTQAKVGTEILRLFHVETWWTTISPSPCPTKRDPP